MRLWPALLVLLAGCAPQDPGLLIRAALTSDDQCTYSESNPTLLSGALDTTSFTPIRYQMAALYANQLIDLGEPGANGPPRSDPNLITVTRARVEIRNADNVPLALPGVANPYETAATGFVPSSDGTTLGQGIGVIEVIPGNVGEALRGLDGLTILASIQPIGSTAGGARVLGTELLWPIRLCAGCLLLCGRDSDSQPICRPTCNPGQDEAFYSPQVCDPASPLTCVIGG
ncbi:MAG: hypothetical protein IT378_20100 [Sandaracinaceae bacterium]|nr:hypothetical protein [Sandaracinaceae bacterium]MCC6876616.1 hypothetical protein [Sandaracinaceae bacterium]